MRLLKLMFLFLGIALLFVLPILTGCDQPAEEESVVEDDEVAEETKKVGILFPTTVVERFVLEADLIEEGLVELGYEVIGNQFANDDATVQMEQAQNMLSLGADLLIVNPVDMDASAQIVEEAHAEGVPVISYVRMVGGDVDYYVSEDNEAVGTLQGEFMANNLQEGNIIVLTGDPLDANAHLYRDTAVAEIQHLIDSGDINIVADQFNDGWSPSEAHRHTEIALTSFDNDIQGVLATNDGTAGGAIEALQAQGLAGNVIVTGGDCEAAAAKRIWEGTQTMTVLKHMGHISSACVEAADAVLKGEEPDVNEHRSNEFKEVPSVLVPMIVITKDNFVEELIDSGYFTPEELGIEID